MIDVRCPKCKSDSIYMAVDIEIDVNEREFTDDAHDMVEDALASGDEVQCGDCSHKFELDDTEDDDEDEE